MNDYTQFYKEVRGYASNYASRLFRDEGARIEAVDKAMDLVVDRLLETKVTLSLAKSIAHNALINIRRDTRANENKNLKVRLSQIKGLREHEIMSLYSKGMRPVEIARGLGIDSGYVRKVVIKWTV